MPSSVQNHYREVAVTAEGELAVDLGCGSGFQSLALHELDPSNLADCIIHPTDAIFRARAQAHAASLTKWRNQ
jgi:hypothetical protein